MDSIRAQVASGTLGPGDQLPSIRELAAQLRINPSSAVKAYNELRHAGVIVLDHGKGTFVSAKPGLAAKSRHEFLDAELSKLLDKTRDLGFSDKDVLAVLARLSRGGRK